ncbi:ASCH domain-containing protein [Streptomyces sp. NPDC007063]|uniref:ASCH domain-containing protein n=1 Tax=Streptomyces sp. NPDC007063 TaxID=3364772 RepID=UPI0036CD1736
MRALTVRQPWADAITHGSKHVENRTWELPAKHVGTRILIHAGQGYDPMGRFIIADHDLVASWPDTRGAITAAATLTGSHWSKDGTCCRPWGQEVAYHWQLADVVALPAPVPCKGRLGFWTPPADVLAAVEQQLAEATR